MRAERFKGALLSALVIASLIVPVVLLSSPSPVYAALTPHAPISINGNAGFTSPDPVNGGGSGTLGDPYIIENYIIDASTANGIYIRNTTAYFVVRNCVVENGMVAYYYGIYLYNVVNGRVENNTCENNYLSILLSTADNNIVGNNIVGNNSIGIYLFDSDNNTLTNNTCKNNGNGIDLYWNSSNNIIENCTIENNVSYGFNLYRSSNNKLRNNTLSNNTYNFHVWGSEISHFYHDVDTSNEVNGKPIYYVTGQENLTFDGNFMDVGYLGLVSCENIQVKNITLSNNGNGLLLAYTSFATITNCIIKNNYYGIEPRFSNSIIENCTIENNVSYGFNLYYSSDNNIITNCTIKNNGTGIYLRDSSENNLITQCTFEGNSRGILLTDYSDNNTIENCVAENNQDGIYLLYSLNNKLRNNILTNNTYNFHVWGDNISHFYHDIDTSNETNGRSIYYVIEQENLTFDGDVMSIGFFALVSCENILVKNLDISNNNSGVMLANTSHSTITNCTLNNNRYSINIWGSSNNTFTNCHVENNSEWGAWLGYSSENNSIYHNNFVNNVNQAWDEGSNYWDNGYPSGGNYWSDYAGSDANDDGIGDTPYYILGDNNWDRYPLMNPRRAPAWNLIESWTGTLRAPFARMWIYPSDDSYVRSDYPNSNYGDVEFLYVTGNPAKHSFLKFSLSDIPFGAIIENAYLKLYAHDASGAPVIQGRCVNNDNWGEITITWDNQPPYDDVLDVENVETTGAWYSWTVTNFVSSQLGGNKVASFCLRVENENASYFVLFRSKEYDGYDPYLEVTYAFSWTGTATISLVDLYTVNVEKILGLNQGSKLVTKFYTYGDAFENENVIENFSPPWHVEENENARHPEGTGVKIAKLDLTTDDTENVISTIASFTVTRNILYARIVDIYLEWPFASVERRNVLMSEIVGIYLQWPFAPT